MSSSAPPSKVLHIRTASPDEKEVDLTFILPFLANFGTVVYVVTMPRIQQALVEMENLEAAKKAFTYAEGNVVDVSGKKFYVHYSKSQAINREPSYRRSMLCCFELLSVGVWCCCGVCSVSRTPRGKNPACNSAQPAISNHDGYCENDFKSV
jgi:hypothetical protein